MPLHASILKPKASGFRYQLLRKSLVAHWAMGESATSGDVTSRDGSGRGYHLTSNNSVLSATGKIGNGRAFVAANSEWLSVASNDDLTFNRDKDWTISVWVYPTSNNSGMFLAKDVATGREFEFKKTGDNGLFFSFTDLGGATFATASNTVALNTWHHIVVTNSSLTTTLYKNASVVGGPQDFGSNWPTANTPLTIGRRGYAGANEYFDGTIDEVAIWRRALTSGEVSDLYNSGDGIDLGQRT